MVAIFTLIKLPESTNFSMAADGHSLKAEEHRLKALLGGTA
jgi:hypothetical protein